MAESECAFVVNFLTIARVMELFDNLADYIDIRVRVQDMCRTFSMNTPHLSYQHLLESLTVSKTENYAQRHGELLKKVRNVARNFTLFQSFKKVIETESFLRYCCMLSNNLEYHKCVQVYFLVKKIPQMNFICHFPL